VHVNGVGVAGECALGAAAFEYPGDAVDGGHVEVGEAAGGVQAPACIPVCPRPIAAAA